MPLSRRASVGTTGSGDSDRAASGGGAVEALAFLFLLEGLGTFSILDLVPEGGPTLMETTELSESSSSSKSSSKKEEESA